MYLPMGEAPCYFVGANMCCLIHLGQYTPSCCTNKWPDCQFSVTHAVDGASLGRASVQFGAARTHHEILCLCCHSSSTPVLSTRKDKGTEVTFFAAVS